MLLLDACSKKLNCIASAFDNVLACIAFLSSVLIDAIPIWLGVFILVLPAGVAGVAGSALLVVIIILAFAFALGAAAGASAGGGWYRRP